MANQDTRTFKQQQSSLTSQPDVKVPPQNVEAEKSVLGSMLIDADAIGIVIEILNESCFYQESHQMIFRNILDLYNNRKNVDLITLSDRLKAEGILDKVGGVTYLSMLIDLVPSSANVEYYAQIVNEKSIKRRLIKNATQIIGESYEATASVNELVDRAEKAYL